MEFKRSRILVGLALGALAVAALAQPGPRRGGPGGPGGPGKLEGLPEVVRRCFKNYGKWRYTGTRTVELRSEGNRITNREFITVDGLFSRTEFSDDSPAKGQIIVENARERLHYFPGTNEIQITPRLRDETFQRLRMIVSKRDGKWQVRFSPGGSLASRATTLMVASDPQGNPFQKLWFDNETGLILKREIFDRVGTRIGAYEFSQINFRPTISPADFEIKRRGAKIVRPNDRIRELAAANGFEPARITDPSATLQHVRIVPSPQGKILAQVYTIGSGRVSLYQLKSRVNDRRLEQQLGRELSSYRWAERDRTFVLIGDLSQAELKRLAETVR